MSRPYSVTVRGDARRSPARWRRNAASDSSSVTLPALPRGRRARPTSRNLHRWRLPHGQFAGRRGSPRCGRSQTYSVHGASISSSDHGATGARARARASCAARSCEHSSPRGIGQSVGVGVFAGCTPVGFHAAIALGLATALRLNRLWAFLASRVSILPVYLAYRVLSEIEAGALRADRRALAPHSASEALARRYELAVDWLLGTLPRRDRARPRPRAAWPTPARAPGRGIGC